LKGVEAQQPVRESVVGNLGCDSRCRRHERGYETWTYHELLGVRVQQPRHLWVNLAGVVGQNKHRHTGQREQLRVLRTEEKNKKSDEKLAIFLLTMMAVGN
jgi:hypothetical protein